MHQEDNILLGKHFGGTNENKWGFASLSICEGDTRPQETAAKLLEVSTLGISGSASTIKKQCEYVGKTLRGLIVYKSVVEKNIEKKIGNVCKYLQKCFPLASTPIGLIPWKKCKSITLSSNVKDCDDITLETLEFLRARAPILSSLLKPV